MRTTHRATLLRVSLAGNLAYAYERYGVSVFAKLTAWLDRVKADRDEAAAVLAAATQSATEHEHPHRHFDGVTHAHAHGHGDHDHDHDHDHGPTQD